VEVHTSQLVNPTRLMVELRTASPTVTPTVTPTAMPPIPMRPPSAPKLSPPPTIKASAPKGDAVERVTYTPPAQAPAAPVAPPPAAPVEPVATPVPAPVEAAAKPAPEPVKMAEVKTPAPAKKPDTRAESLADTAKAARHTSSGDTSLVRALGLKLQRVVIDPGHGGHDQGTEGPHGLLEKELVLDISQKLGKMIEDRLGAEVVYTRTDDTFIPLKGRTEMANEKKADLFLSIHANSSPVPRITGVETYYLSLTNSKEANDLAQTENKTAEESIFELRDMLQKIALNDKVEESKEFAGRVQAALFAFSAHNFPTEKNRGIKKAPFVVLIGANMPSILAEIGFVSNPREEALLKKQDYRQKLAEAIFRGVSRYAESLSHFQVAQNSNSNSK
jgi:N-acetylmuramoyl-L-alanine amidase